MASGFNFFTDHIDVTPGSQGSWQDIDVSSHIPAGSSGVLLHLVNTSAGRFKNAVRKNGSSDTRIPDIDSYGHTYALVGVDASRIFEGYIEYTATQEMYLIGYTDSSVTFFTNAIDVSLGSTGSWIDIDNVNVPDSATGVIVEIYNTDSITPYQGGIRCNSSSDTYPYGDIYGSSHIYQLCGVDASGIFEGEIEHTDVDFYIVGYTESPITFFTDGIDKSLSTTGAWTDIDITSDTSATADGAIVDIKLESTTPYQGDIRKEGSTNDYGTKIDITDDYGCLTAFCGLDSSQVFEGKIENIAVDFYLIGYCESPAGYTITASPGSYTETGSATNLLRDGKITGGTDAYNLTGQIADLLKGYNLSAGANNYTLTGQDVTFDRTYILPAGIGGYTLTGIQNNLLKDSILPIGVGNYTLTGFASNLEKGYKIASGSGAYILSGQIANLIKGYKISSSPGTYTLTGIAADLLRGYLISANTTNYSLSGTVAGLLKDSKLPAAGGTYTLTGSPVDLLQAFKILIESGAYTFTGYTVNLTHGGAPSGKPQYLMLMGIG